MLVDMETEFLDEDLDEEIPVGLNEVYSNSINNNDASVLMKKGIYGLR